MAGSARAFALIEAVRPLHLLSGWSFAFNGWDSTCAGSHPSRLPLPNVDSCLRCWHGPSAQRQQGRRQDAKLHHACCQRCCNAPAWRESPCGRLSRSTGSVQGAGWGACGLTHADPACLGLQVLHAQGGRQLDSALVLCYSPGRAQHARHQPRRHRAEAAPAGQAAGGCAAALDRPPAAQRDL